MLQSQFTANAQHPDKYDGHEFTPRKAKHLPLDGSPLTEAEQKFLREKAAFMCPRLADKYGVLSTTPLPPPDEVLTISPRSASYRRNLKILLHNLRAEGRWLTHKEVSGMVGGSKSSVTNYLKDLTGSGRVVRKSKKGCRQGAFVYKATPATP